MKNAVMIAFTVLIAGSTPAFAKGGPDMNFADIDANGDGQITQAEMQAHGQSRFDGADTDGDGGLNATEMAAQIMEMFQSRAKKRAEKMISKMDENGDGILGQDELSTHFDMEKRMSKLDEDGDGMISAEEFESRKGKRGRRG